MPPLSFSATIIIVCSVWGANAKIGGWDSSPNTQYHIQTDEGPERYFRYQTVSGQYRKEKRLQDGTVVGTSGWVDAEGFLRLQDYIADDKGYRIVRTKMVRVEAPAQSVTTPPKKYSSTLPPISLSDYLKQKNKEEKYGSTPKPITLSEYLKTPQVEVNNNGYPSTTASPPYSSSTTPESYPSTTAEPYHSTTPGYVRPVTFRPYYNPNTISYVKKLYDSVGASKYEASGTENVPRFNGVELTHNGFRYYLPRHYHEEENLDGERRAGSFGYIDPFGIRRVIYYNTSPESGFVHRKNNRYVGFQSTPYDPRY
ncbi:uncharacterized protein LOC106669075 [Cimex lectularius]|uniref:CPR type cuticle protein n=1 Tax=Cimex lectularius TaxID=79782 RepID=A0A8I6S0X5_CIMLE|nr:uncharacterized protein LOC106669075 [Cimex lectularius]